MQKQTPAVFSFVHLVVAVVLGGVLVGCADAEHDVHVFPRRPIRLIVPFAAGGGSDTFGRIIQNAIEANDLLPQPLVIINVPGAGGTIGSRRVKNARPDGYTLLLLHEGILTARHTGSASYGPEAFTPIAGTGNATQVVAVRDASPHRDLSSLMLAATEQPDSIVFSANIGAPSHFAGLMLEAEASGASFRYTQTGGGAKRFAALQGGHVDASAFSIAEYVQFRPSGIRALALLGPHRHPELPELATAREQGFDVISENMQFWWTPLGTPAERVNRIADALEAAMQTDAVQERLSEMNLSDVIVRGDALAAELEARERRIASVAPSAGIELPNFAAMVFGGVVLTGIVALIQSVRRRRAETFSPAPTERAESLDRPGRRALVVVGSLTLLYVACLQQSFGFVPTTAAYAILCGGVLARPRIRKRRITTTKAVAALAAVGVIMSFVMHYVFTEVLIVDLP